MFENYKKRVIKKTSEKLETYKENSGSWILTDRLFMILLDLIMWIIIAFFVYTWWITRGQTTVLTCSDISVDICNSCFNQVKGMGINLSGLIK